MHAAATSSPLTIIEPKLRGPSGHYAEFVRALASRSHGLYGSIEVVADPRARAYVASLGGAVPVVASRPAAGTISEIAAIGASLRAGRTTLVLTANASHALHADWLSFAGPHALSGLALLYHWPLVKRQARMALALAPRAQRHALFLATTRGVRDSLAAAGCVRAIEIAYPATRSEGAPMRASFRHLLMAGAARVNKGLDVVAELAERFSRAGRDLPLLVQVSPKHVDRHGSREDAVVRRLLDADYRGLVADPKAPDRAEYAARFTGALVLAPYARAQFAHGVSGIVLDALLHGAPCIATEGTWAGDLVGRFDAGMVLRERTAEELGRAIDAILARWDHYAARAAEASDELVVEHDPRRVVELLASGGA